MKIIAFSFCFFLVISSVISQNSSYRCTSAKRLQNTLKETPKFIQKRNELEHFTNAILKDSHQVFQREVITIPIVVHVVWNNPEENISDEQIFSQIEVLNEDFRAKNNEFTNIPEEFKSVSADVELEFCLAGLDPEGNPVSGIIRTSTDIENIGTAYFQGKRRIFYSDLEGQDAWDSDRYLNIWVAQREFAEGESSFPEAGLPEEDGLVVNPKSFGRTGTAMDNAPFNLGRTVTHEVGHYFNLFHIWGETGCETDDEVGDTPIQHTHYLGQCPSHPQSSCGSHDMFMNFMDYTNDACLSMFTEGQKLRMLATLESVRTGLGNAIACSIVGTEESEFSKIFNLSPNPCRDEVIVKSSVSEVGNWEVIVYDLAGRVRYFEKPLNVEGIKITTIHWEKGIYIVHCRSDERLWTSKVVKL
ncbi:MAG: T9SS type A sorting domain-containing protein [Bacteroidetes bacterium]|nr:T9SS type A sorting domain-containing protein [Bacteroidota bacterium]